MAIMAENDAIANKNLLPSSKYRSNQRELFFIRNCWYISTHNSANL